MKDTELNTPQSSTMQSILIVDDDKFIHKVISKTLANIYIPIYAINGQEAIEKATVLSPDLIILDVEMPGMNGYEVCDRLKHLPDTAEIPVIFLSSKGSVRERMLGYEVGAVDFLTKPFDKEELIAKLDIHNHHRTTKKALEVKVDDVSRTALTAMAGSSDLGQVIQFMERTYNIRTFEQLAAHFFQALNTFSLSGCLLFSTADKNIFFSSKGEVNPLEKEIMLRLKSTGNRFYDFGCRTQISYPRVVLLVKNMPIDNRERYGRYKDLLPSLLEAADAKVKALDVEYALLKQTQHLSSSIDQVSETMSNLESSLDYCQQKIMAAMKEMLLELEQKLLYMGLEEDQETYLSGRVDLAYTEITDFNEKIENIHASFNTVDRLFKYFSERQQKIVDSVFSRFDDKVADDEYIDSDSDIELF